MDDFLNLLKAKLEYAGLEDLPATRLLEVEILNAIGEINRRRNHSSTDNILVAPGYERFVVPMAAAVILKTGAEGQDSHSENGVSRGYSTDGDYPRDILKQITWVVR